MRKLYYLYLFFIPLLLFSCMKDSKNTNHSEGVCENVSLHVTNSLDKEISELVIEGVEIGLLKASETIEHICLDQVEVSSKDIPLLSELYGIYEGQEVGQYIIYCGPNMELIANGSYHIVLESIEEKQIIFSSL